MLFVHLTDVRNVAHIKKYGLRTEGDGRWIGVFCVPLVQMEPDRWVDGRIKINAHYHQKHCLAVEILDEGEAATAW
jgi:hypothetical protein